MVRNAIIGFVGDLGSGKTLCMTYFAFILSVGLKTDIYSNYFLNFKEYGNAVNINRMDKKFLKSFFDLSGDAFKTVNNTLLLLDEISSFLDSYEQMGKNNKIFSKFLLQSRKRKVKVLYTAQYTSLIPKRMRLVTNMIVRPVYDDINDSLLYSVYKFDGKFEKHLYTRLVPKASRYFGLYDTEQVIDVLDEL